jgi:hypothetical protein
MELINKLVELLARGVVALETIAENTKQAEFALGELGTALSSVEVSSTTGTLTASNVTLSTDGTITGDGKTVAGQAAEAQQAAMAAVERSRKEAVEQAQKPAAQAETKATKPPTVDDVRKALGAYAKAHGNPAAMAVLQKHEAASVSALHEDKRQALIDDCKL